MQSYKKEFDSLLGVKTTPNDHEIYLFERARKYIQKLSKIPGVEMIAIVNSLSMYTTHKDSDIDLFIVTKPDMIWFVRFWATLILFSHRVWRKNQDIAANFCLSFFITTDAMDLSQVAIEDDIYLYYWIYYMKPIFMKDDIYEQFLEANNWVIIDDIQRERNQIHALSNSHKAVNSMGFGERNCLSQPESNVEIAKGASLSLPNSFDTFSTKSREICVGKLETWIASYLAMTGNGIHKNIWIFYKNLNNLIRYFLLPHTLKSYEKLSKPEGVIISDTMLKFHDQDKRKQIRDTILEKNFDK